MTLRRNEPAFRRVWADLRTQILSQTFADGIALPTEAELADRYSVSRQTIRRAFQDLVSEGLVHRAPGRGTFATPPSGRYLRQLGSIDDLIALSADSQLKIIVTLGGVVDPTAAGRLRLGDDHVAKTVFVRLHNGEPFCHTSVYLPPAVRARLGAVKELVEPGMVSPVTVIGLVDQALENPIQDAEQSITVATAPAEVAESLGLPPRTPVLRIDRMYLDDDAAPVELAINHFHPDRYSYRVRLRRHLP
ncbi:MAG: GntR family transcriptional regulator [Streptosporangiales bacterium]|nr:GntR family transcriptional regulator [Streptosporangiales bacterium]